MNVPPAPLSAVRPLLFLLLLLLSLILFIYSKKKKVRESDESVADDDDTKHLTSFTPGLGRERERRATSALFQL
jgi:hypothetical protein